MLMGCRVLLPVRPVPGGSHVPGPLNPRWNQGKQSGIPGKAAWGRWEGGRLRLEGINLPL